MTFGELEAEIRSGPFGPKTAAVFDVDGTLIGGYPQPAADERRFVELVERGLAEWAGRPYSELLELGERSFAGEVAGELLHDAWWLVKAHQRAGHTVVLATSATEAQVAPLARELGVEHVVCTRFETDGGRLTGRVAGRAPWGPGKLAAVRDLLTAQGVRLEDTHAYAHGADDVPLLTAVGHPHPVDPEPGLAAAAADRGWPVLRIDSARPARLDPRPALRTAGIFGTLFAAAGLGIAAGVLNDDRRRGIDLTMSAFDVLAGPLAGVRVDVVGQEHAWSHRPAVFFINHQSTLIDLLVTARVIRTGYTAVAKAEVKQMPVVGPLFDLAGVAFLDRADRAKAIDALRPAVETLRAGVSVVMAPEGTRSLTPRLGRFKKGGFHLAMQAGVPIVPIVIRNAGEIMWRNAKTVRAGTVQVAVLPPVPTEGWRVQDLDEKVVDIRNRYLETLENWPTRERRSTTKLGEE